MSQVQNVPSLSSPPRSPRRRVVLRGRVESLNGHFPVSVKNLSCTGAMVEGASVPLSGRDVILRAGTLDCFATVVWSEGNRCGLRFDEPIDMADVLALHQITAEHVEHQEMQSMVEWFQTQGRFARM